MKARGNKRNLALATSIPSISAGRHLLGKTVAVQSIGAMLFRTAIWIGINFMIRGEAKT